MNTPQESVFGASGAERHAARTCIGRNGELADLHGPTVFLCSDAGAYVTGQTVVADGGYELLGPANALQAALAARGAD